jgi:hypothetical protein
MQAIELCVIVSVCVAIVYWLDAPNDIASYVMSLLLGREVHVQLRKPWGCSICMTFWLTLIVLLIVQPSLWWVSFVCAWNAKYLYYFIVVFDKVIVKVFTTIEEWLNG